MLQDQYIRHEIADAQEVFCSAALRKRIATAELCRKQHNHRCLRRDPLTAAGKAQPLACGGLY